ncbi:MAG: hypothetical protein ACM3OF_16845, partial [Gemmatimonas sp.]
MRKLVFAAVIGVVAVPAFAGDVAVRVHPVHPGVTIGETHRTTVVKEHEPRDRTTVIKKEDELGNRSKTV